MDSCDSYRAADFGRVEVRGDNSAVLLKIQLSRSMQGHVRAFNVVKRGWGGGKAFSVAQIPRLNALFKAGWLSVPSHYLTCPS